MSSVACRGCGSSELRISHLRTTDVGKLLSLRYPVRCRMCHERDFVFLPFALGLGRKSSRHKDADAPENGHA
jgi:ribosomal protein L40E